MIARPRKSAFDPLRTFTQWAKLPEMRRAIATMVLVLLVIVTIPFAAAVSLLAPKAKLTASEVAAYLRNFLDGRGGEWDWDDFTSVPIADARLDDIRRKAAAVDLPATDEGLVILRQLLAEAEGLVTL